MRTGFVVKESYSRDKARREIMQRGESMLIRAAHKRPTEPAVALSDKMSEFMKEGTLQTQGLLPPLPGPSSWNSR